MFAERSLANGTLAGPLPPPSRRIDPMRSLLPTGVWSALLCAWLAAFAATPQRAVAQLEDHQYSAADIQAGSRLYGAQCALCHGQNGDGVAGVNLPRQQFRRASSDDDIRNTITTGVAAAGMPPFRLQPAELDALVAFIRSGFDISATPFKVGDAGRGKAVYDGKGACAACHRVAGKGARTAPDLSDIGAIRAAGRDSSGPFSNPAARWCRSIAPCASSRATDAPSAAEGSMKTPPRCS